MIMEFFVIIYYYTYYRTVWTGKNSNQKFSSGYSSNFKTSEVDINEF